MKSDIKIGKKHRQNLLKKTNVVGVGIGFREKGGRRTKEKSIIVFVTKKMPLQQLSSEEVVPRSLRGQSVDVIEVGEIRFMEGTAPQPDEEGAPPGGGRVDRLRPAPGGVSIGHYKVTAGTFSCTVKDRATGERLILSNNHVLANSSAGEDGRALIGDPVLQPGAYDGGRLESDVLGRLERFIPLLSTFQPPDCTTARYWEKVANKILAVLRPYYRVVLERASVQGNLVDAAVARPLIEEDLSAEIMALGQITGTAEVYPGDEVVFSGRTSGVVQGTVIARNTSLYITMEPGKELYFTDQLITSAISRPGDSGSLLLDRQNHAVGLLFAGSETVSVSNRLENVFNLLGIEAVFD